MQKKPKKNKQNKQNTRPDDAELKISKTPTAYLETLVLLAYFQRCPCIDIYFIHCCLNQITDTKQNALNMSFLKMRLMSSA